MISIIKDISEIVKNVFDVFKKKSDTQTPIPMQPIQIITVYSSDSKDEGLRASVNKRIANMPQVEPDSMDKKVGLPMIIMPTPGETPKETPDEPEFMSDEYLVDLAVDLNKTVRSGDRLIFIDKKYDSQCEE